VGGDLAIEGLAAERQAPEKYCPSAQPDMVGAVAFGIVGGSAEHPLVSYLDRPQPVTPELLALAKPVEPTEVFRFAAPCAKDACQHFDGANCQLARKLAQNMPSPIHRLPPCRLRPSCRWWHEQGPLACFRCPLVVTTDYGAAAELREAADPSTTMRIDPNGR